jgi:hypothetical protein
MVEMILTPPFLALAVIAWYLYRVTYGQRAETSDPGKQNARICKTGMYSDPSIEAFNPCYRLFPGKQIAGNQAGMMVREDSGIYGIPRCYFYGQGGTLVGPIYGDSKYCGFNQA